MKVQKTKTVFEGNERRKKVVLLSKVGTKKWKNES